MLDKIVNATDRELKRIKNKLVPPVYKNDFEVEGVVNGFMCIDRNSDCAQAILERGFVEPLVHPFPYDPTKLVLEI